jgi:hypothetical protein
LQVRIALRRPLKRKDLQSPRRERTSAFVHHILLDNEAAFFQQRAKLLASERRPRPPAPRRG